MSDTPTLTPMTDAFKERAHVAWDGMWIEHAEKLERELTAAQAENAELRKVIQENIATIKALSEQVGAASASARPNESNLPTK